MHQALIQQVRNARPVYADGPYSPVFFSYAEEGLRTYTHRRVVPGCYQRGDLIATIVHYDSEREFVRRYVDTEALS